MASSARQGYVDPYSSFNYGEVLESARKEQGLDYFSGGSDTISGGSGFSRWLADLVGFNYEGREAKADAVANAAYERASIESARAWSEYMDNTQIRRRVNDLEAAGLNPWLAIQNGVSASGQPSVDTGGSARKQSKSKQSRSGLGMLLMALAKILG